MTKEQYGVVEEGDRLRSNAAFMPLAAMAQGGVGIVKDGEYEVMSRTESGFRISGHDTTVFVTQWEAIKYLTVV